MSPRALTGGRSFHLRQPKDLQPTLQSVAEDLRTQYLIGYEPSRAPRLEGDDWRAITVKVSRPGATVRARSGYPSR